MARFIQADGRVHGVVVAVRDGDGRYLCIRRSDKVPAPLKVCFPGGGVEANESQHDAVIREMREELGLTVRPVRQIWKWDSATSPLTLWGWMAEIVSGEIQPDPHEVSEVLWLSGQAACEHADCMATNRSFVAALNENMKRPRG